MTQLSHQALTNLHVVITRPNAQAMVLRTRLENLGANTSLVPMLAIDPVKDDPAQQAIKNCVLALAEYQKVIFVSQNAVAHAWQWIDQYWPQLPEGIEYFAIGSSTAECLEQHAKQQNISLNSAARAMNSEALLALPELGQVSGQKILIFRGCGGRPTLADQLQQRGAQVDLCELYQRVLPKAATTEFQALLPRIIQPPCERERGNSAKNCVLSVHSGESLVNLVHVLNSVIEDSSTLMALKKLPLLVPGQRVAELARQQGFSHLITALNATDKDMTEALSTWNDSIRGEQ